MSYIPEPVTRTDKYLSYIAGNMDVTLPDHPITRKEHYLAAWAEKSGFEDVDVTGEPPLTLENAIGKPFKGLKLYGKSKQATTTGAQLFPPPSLGSQEKNGITIDCMENGKIRISGTAETNVDFYLSRLQLPAGTYTFSVGVNIDANALRCTLVTPEGVPYFDVNGDYITNTIKEPIKVSLLLRVYTGKSIDLTVQPMLNIGSTPLPWEPYTGGKPSPSPDYPQGIESAGDVGEIALNVLGKNLIPFKEIPKSTRNGITITTKSNGIVHFKGTATARYDSPIISLQGVSLPKGRYCVIQHNSISFLVVVKKMAGNMAWYSNIVKIEDGDEPLYCYFTVLEGVTVNEDAYVYMQMDNGGTLSKSDFEPYKPTQKLIIPTSGGLPGIPVSSGGNYTDEKGQQWVCNTIELRNNVAEMVQRIERIDLKATRWQKVKRLDATGGFFFISQIKKPALYNTTVMGTTSNILRIGNPFTNFGDYIWVLTNNSVSECRIGFTDSTIDSTEKLTNLFNSLPEAYAMYCIVEPIRTPFSPETIAAYKQLHTYKGTTIIDNDAGAYMSVRYEKMK